MSFFNVFQELGLVTEKGDIRQDFEERVDGMILQDRIRKAWLWEETEDFEAWDTLHQDKYAKEFIFNLFMHLQIGGSLNQYDNNMADYLKVVKNLYKDFITVTKDQETGEIKSASFVFRIDSAENVVMYTSQNKDHYQNATYVIVDPINWHVTLMQNKWEDYW